MGLGYRRSKESLNFSRSDAKHKRMDIKYNTSNTELDMRLGKKAGLLRRILSSLICWGTNAP